MPVETFGSSNTNLGAVTNSGWAVVLIFAVLAAVVVAAYVYWSPSTSCPTELERRVDGSLKLYPSGQEFKDENEFQQWWHNTGINATCPIPVLRGARARQVLRTEMPAEETYARTPINKVDDYEFSRVFGFERGDRMIVPRQNFDKLLLERFFDWTQKPLTADDRKKTYAGLTEGFSADGDLKSELVTREAVSRFGERSHDRKHDEECEDERARDRKEREVAKLVARAYASDPEYEPVVTQVGPNHWEVNELKPRARRAAPGTGVVDERVVDTSNEHVDVEWRFREKEVTDAALDPYFTKTNIDPVDPYRGYVPGLERMFGPTLDHRSWT